uniref:Uncharacterized protein n=1 Tax=Podoviridae sp. ctlpi2 TaxID=2826574 RepID=A0A8S5MLP7_9CAUD|nr:MAG TPA: hypothetical protein [Podoviridae sp. ctlpi2]
MPPFRLLAGAFFMRYSPPRCVALSPSDVPP